MVVCVCVGGGVSSAAQNLEKERVVGVPSLVAQGREGGRERERECGGGGVPSTAQDLQKERKREWGYCQLHRIERERVGARGGCVCGGKGGGNPSPAQDLAKESGGTFKLHRAERERERGGGGRDVCGWWVGEWGVP